MSSKVKYWPIIRKINIFYQFSQFKIEKYRFLSDCLIQVSDNFGCLNISHRIIKIGIEESRVFLFTDSLSYTVFIYAFEADRRWYCVN